jgi:hypothetical protein
MTGCQSVEVPPLHRPLEALAYPEHDCVRKYKRKMLLDATRTNWL